MRRSRALPCAMLLAAAAAAWGEDPVRYEIRFDNADHHEAEVTATFTSVPNEVLELAMSRSSPGRYALHEFAKNVYRLRAEDGAGRVLEVSHREPSRWEVSGHDGTVVVRYSRKAELVLQGDPAIEVVLFENVGREATEAILRFREQWLSSGAGN